MDAHVNALALAAAGGDSEALASLVRELRPMILRYCRARLGSDAIAGVHGPEDVTQEVLIALIVALPRLDPDIPVVALVYGIASKKVADVFRATLRDRSDPVAEVPDLPAPPTAAPHLVEERSLRRAGLSDQQIAVVQGMLLGISAQEHAAATGRTAVAVRKDRQRALRRLRASMVRRTDAPPPMDPRERAVIISALSSRELAIVRAVVRGDANAGIAAALGMSGKAVEGALTGIYRRMGVRSRAELATRHAATFMSGSAPYWDQLAGAELRAALDALSPIRRQVLVMRVFLGLSAEETARVLDTTPGAVRVVQHRALVALRRVVLPPTSS